MRAVLHLYIFVTDPNLLLCISGSHFAHPPSAEMVTAVLGLMAHPVIESSRRWEQGEQHCVGVRAEFCLRVKNWGGYKDGIRTQATSK